MPLGLYFDEVVARVRKKEKVNVVFIATSLSLWRYQNLCELMRAHPRFRVHVVILPFMGYSESQRLKDVSVLKAHFESCGIEYHVGGSTTSLDIRKELDPDMLFYPQPYKRLFAKKDDFRSFKDRLLCYYQFVTCNTRMPRNRKETLMEQDYKKLKEFYINAIIKMLNNCNDISLLDLIKKLLEKCV